MKMPQDLSLTCFGAGKAPGVAEQCFSSFPLPSTNARMLCLSWINWLAIIAPSKGFPFTKINRGLPVLTSKIHRPMREQGPSPKACWDFPALKMALKPWEAAGKWLGQRGAAWVRDALRAGWHFSSAQLLSYLKMWAAGCSK